MPFNPLPNPVSHEDHLLNYFLYWPLA